MSENTTPKAKTFAERAAAEPTDLHKRFADWIKEQTGVEVDLKTVQLVTTMRMDFQKSDENQTALKERKDKAAKAKVEAALKRKAKLEAELAKLNGEVVAEVETKPEEPAEAPKEEAATEPTEPAKKATPARRRRSTTTAKK